MLNIKTIEYTNKKVKKEFRTKKHYKLVILIIASHNVHYNIFKHCWLQYMNNFPEVKSFFLYADETIENDLLISDDSITYKCEESYIPGILLKTLASMRFCQKYMSYNFLLRTNLSSFIHIPRLLEYLSRQEQKDFMCTNIEYFPLVLNDNEFDENDKCISGVIEYNKENWKKHTAVLKDFFGYKKFLENNTNFYFLTGSFFVLSIDVVEKILYEVYENNILKKSDLYTIPDDLAITAIVQQETIQPYNFNTTSRYSNQCKKIEKPSEYNEKIYHIRNRTDLIFGNRDVDIMNMVEQVRFFYNKPEFLME